MKKPNKILLMINKKMVKQAIDEAVDFELTDHQKNTMVDIFFENIKVKELYTILHDALVSKVYDLDIESVCFPEHDDSYKYENLTVKASVS